MARTPEGAVKDAVRKLLTEMGIYHFMPAANGFGRAGVFDIVACVNGFFVGIECKKNAKTPPTALQTREAQRLQLANGVAFLANGVNIKELEVLLTQITEFTNGTNWLSFWPFAGSAESAEW